MTLWPWYVHETCEKSRELREILGRGFDVCKHLPPIGDFDGNLSLMDEPFDVAIAHSFELPKKFRFVPSVTDTPRRRRLRQLSCPSQIDRIDFGSSRNHDRADLCAERSRKLGGMLSGQVKGRLNRENGSERRQSRYLGSGHTRGSHLRAVDIIYPVYSRNGR